MMMMMMKSQSLSCRSSVTDLQLPEHAAQLLARGGRLVGVLVAHKTADQRRTLF